MSGGFVLRVLTPADPVDWPLWRDARLAALADAPDAFRVRLADWSAGGEAEWRARFARADAVHVVAVAADGRPAGLAGGVPGLDDRGAVSELRSVWVGPRARGRGVGDGLLAAVEAWARRRGSTSLRLAVLSGNAAAVALYRRHGFVDAEANGEDREGREDGEDQQHGAAERVMVKRLRA
ncbi:GNAT family N-acetyltransferase [Kitasatospora sp. NPDC056184]|uniref:GNAT family N-acetyltransferase n=1 Tax=Kitasatospora sp. NPDC056184 TaxID=3345738 RepID=UPI0035D5B438